MEASRLEKEQLAIQRIVNYIDDHHPHFSARRNAVVAGSGAMVMNGIDRDKQIGDIDIFVTSELWIRLLQSGEWSVFVPEEKIEKRRHDPPFLYRKVSWDVEQTDTIEVSVFFEWRERDWGNISIKELFDSAEEKGRILCVGMEWLLDWKKEVRRPKDLPDIELMEELVGSQ